CVQTPIDGERFASLGVPPERIHVTGNIKFAAARTAATDAGAVRATLGIGPDVELWVCGSTAEGEEDAALEAFRALPRNGVRRLLVIAPRHPERFDTVAQRVGASGLAW